MEFDEASLAPGSPNSADQDVHLTGKAYEEFKIADYDACLQTLSKLETLTSSCTKTRHNRAIAEFYASDFKGYNELLSVLEQLTTLESSASLDASIIRNRPTHVLAEYNKAVIHFHNRQYNMALNIVGAFVEKCERMDKSTATLVCSMFLSLLLQTNQIKRAGRFQQFMEALLNGLGKDDSVTPPLLLHNNEELEREIEQMKILTNMLNEKPFTLADETNPEAALLKAQYFYTIKDFQLASKQLLKVNEFCKTGSYKYLETCIANDMGIIHSRVRNYAIAVTFFQMAIRFNEPIVERFEDLGLLQLQQARMAEIMYNLGVPLLHLKRARDAYHCFLMALKSYPSNPRLWLRVAECCIVYFEEQCKEGIETESIIIEDNESSLPTVTAPQEPCLEFASLCLRNALIRVKALESHLTIGEDNQLSEDGPSWQQTRDNNFCNPSLPITAEAFNNLLAGIYSAQSYVALRTGDYLPAHDAAVALMQMENISSAHKMLAKLYAGQALLLYEKYSEAQQQLEPSFIAGLDASDFETKNWKVKSMDAALSVAQLNQAIALTKQGEHESAKSVLAKCTHTLVANRAATLRRYLDEAINEKTKTCVSN